MNCNRSSWTKQAQKRIQTFAADRYKAAQISVNKVGEIKSREFKLSENEYDANSNTSKVFEMRKVQVLR